MDTFDAISAMYHVDAGDAIAAKVPKDVVVATDDECHEDSDDATAAKAYKGVGGAIVANYRVGCADATVPKA
ncbi:hypothetical protein [Bacillus sp. ISL-7]|uniref:hypothetical protein n=1 Tax=Bacillus sp. ISL-7 TaxID=2819136 RepID=UPI001BE54CD7|nr:hypothetical protein [Bacillus sp. ISL-7]MBT2736433.1 hypothetical protein [Bacillus sp. ISL-7]